MAVKLCKWVRVQQGEREGGREGATVDDGSSQAEHVMVERGEGHMRGAQIPLHTHLEGMS